MPKNVITFVDTDGSRKWLRFGRLNQREFSIVRTRVDRLLSAKLSGDPPDRETVAWLSGASDYVREKLSAAGMVESRKMKTLGEWLDEYLVKRSDVKPSTKLVFGRCRNRLVEFFTAGKPLRSINRGDAKDWRRWLAKRLPSENTVRRQTGVAKQFFASAIDHELIEENPFRGLPCSVRPNKERFRFVTEAESLTVLEACPDDEWRLIFSLARWGGLRVPSELVSLRWSDVDWKTNRLTVRSPKTEHHEGGESRLVPLFPELRPHLELARKRAEAGAEFVLKDTRASNCNLRTRLLKIIKRAGLEPWPKLFQNLRSTRETELGERFPLQAVVAWMGNSQPVALNHYLQVTDDHFEAASSAPQKAPQHRPGSP